MTDNHCMATRLISLGVAVPGLGTVSVPLPLGLTATLRDHSVVQQRNRNPLSSGGVLCGCAVPNMSTGSLGPFLGLRSSEVSLGFTDMGCSTARHPPMLDTLKVSRHKRRTVYSAAWQRLNEWASCQTPSVSWV